MPSRRSNIQRLYFRKVLLLLAGIIAANFLAAQFSARFDLTSEKRFTLSPSTIHLLRHLDGPVRIKIFLKGDFPSGFRHFAESTQQLMQEFQRYAGSRLQYEFVDPLQGLPDTSQQRVKDSLASMGIMPFNVKAQQNLSKGISVQLIFPGAIVDYNGHQLPVNLLQAQPGNDPLDALNHSTSLLEYHFAHALAELSEPVPPLVGYALGNAEPMNPEVYDLLNTLQNNYRLDTVNLSSDPAVGDSVSALVVFKPEQTFSESEKLKLDQYVMHGGKVFWILDRLHASMDSIRAQGSFLAYDNNLNLDDILFTYGVRIDPSLIEDLQCFSIPLTVGQMGTQPEIQEIPWPMLPLFTPSANQVIVKNMEPLLGAFANPIDTIQGAASQKTILLSSSSHSRIIGTPYQVSLDNLKVQPDAQAFKQKHIPVAVLLEGRFTSPYTGRLSAGSLVALQHIYPDGFKAQSPPSKMIVVSDADLFSNAVTQKEGPIPMGMDEYTRQQFANREFFMNCLTYLTDQTNIMESRNKVFILQLLDSQKVASEKSSIQTIALLVPALIIILTGLMLQGIRRRRYGSLR